MVAGSSFSIPSNGGGKATFYLLGPSHVLKREVNLGQAIAVDGDDVQTSGKYLAIACTGHSCDSASFYVVAGNPDRLSFLLHPSRVPVSAGGAINATAFVFDNFKNLVLKPVTVDFHVTPKNGAPFTKTVKAERGVAWMKMSSTPKEGPVKVGLDTPKGGSAQGCKTADAAVVQDMMANPANYYVNVHNASHPKGALRGQLSK